jgi:serine/threonine-protein phosphatase 2A regulatory subunit B
MNPFLKERPFLVDIVNSISDLSITNLGMYVLARDFLSVQIWDTRKFEDGPSCIVEIDEDLENRLDELYYNECIFDRFKVGSCGLSGTWVSGSFNGGFSLCDKDGGNHLKLELDYEGRTRKKVVGDWSSSVGEYDFSRKVLNCAWSPWGNAVAVSCWDGLWIYTADG